MVLKVQLVFRVKLVLGHKGSQDSKGKLVHRAFKAPQVSKELPGLLVVLLERLVYRVLQEL